MIGSREIGDSFSKAYHSSGRKGDIFSGNYDNAAFSNADRLIAQTSLVNRNHLQKLLHVQTSSSIDSTEEIRVYVTLSEDWVNKKYNKYDARYPGVALNAAYIPYLDARANEQIISLDYDIFDGDAANYEPSGNDVSAEMFLIKILILSMTSQVGKIKILLVEDYSKLIRLASFWWRAKSLAQPICFAAKQL